VDPRERIILAAERLIAERGVNASLRDIAAAAGQRNNSAVHYHFGSRDGLIQAVIERRMEPMEQHRLALLAEHEVHGQADDVRALLEILVLPMFTGPYPDGATHYARFLEQVRSHPAIVGARLSAEHWPATQIVTARLHRALAPLPPDTRRQRLSSMATVMFALLADHERSGATPTRDDVIDMLVGLLTADSYATRAVSR
jgi:AcrR family transcriptional regulator